MVGVFVGMGRINMITSQDMIPLSCNRSPYLVTQQIQSHAPWISKHCAHCPGKQTDGLWLLFPTSRPHFPLRGDRLIGPSSHGSHSLPRLVGARRLAEERWQKFFLLLFFLTDKINDDSIKRGKPYKIFFRDLFLFKENEIEARRQVRFY